MAFIDEGAKRECSVAIAEAAHNISVAASEFANNEFEKAQAGLAKAEKYLRQAQGILAEFGPLDEEKQ